MADSGGDQSPIVPFLPWVVLDWLADTPQRRWRAVDATVVFVDVSGFTRLSERLARRGRVGAETLTEVIGSCFSHLLEGAYAEGGSLLKFGGDALLILFAGADHAGRACRAALAMRARLAEVVLVDAPGGRVRLRMSVGVHTGEFLLFLVGGSHRELVIAGPAASETVAMEHQAQAGDILVSRALAARLPVRSVGRAKGSGFLLRHAPELNAANVPTPEVVVAADPMVGIPAGLRDHLQAGANEPEHRVATVAFVHFDGTDALALREGPGALAAALDEMVSVAADAASEHGVTLLGSDIDHDGGKIILAASVPLASGHDEERMLHAVRRIAATPTRLQPRIGVNRGHVFAGAIGPAYRRTYTVMGDTVNLAARLMAAARPGQVLCTGGVLEQSRTHFHRHALEPFTVKGKAKPVQAYELGPPQRRPDADEAASPLIGRSTQLASLRAAADAARQGRGGVVEIQAESGAGKSRLWQELQRDCPDFVHLVVTCVPYESANVYRAVRELLEQLLGAGDTPTGFEQRIRELIETRAPALAEQLPLLAGPLRLDGADAGTIRHLDARFRKQQTDLALAALVAAASAGPTMVLVEDVQWIDDASADVLRLAETSVGDLPWLLGVTRTPDGGGYRPASERPQLIRLEPLGHDDATALVIALSAQDPLRPHEIAAVVERAGGNPRFLVELTREAGTAGSPAALPDSVDGVVSAQIDRLPADARRLLRIASVLGPEFDRATLARLVSEDPRGVRVRPQQFQGLLVAGRAGRVRFSSALLRDVAYQSLSYRQRVALHRRAGAVIETMSAVPEQHDAVLSLHYFIGEDFAAAWRSASRAARRAQAGYANVEAEELFSRALAAARRLDPAPGELAATAEALGDVRDRIGVYDGARAAYRAARRATDDSLSAARLYLKDAWISERFGQYGQALRWIRRGLRALDDAPQSAAADAVRAELAVGEAVVRYAQGRARDAKRACERAVALARTAGDRSALAHALYLLDFANLALGRMDLAVHSGEALSLYEELGDLSGEAVVANNLGALAYFDGRWDDALTLYERSCTARLRTGDAVEAATASTNIAEILIERGQLDAAAARLVEAVRVYRAAPYLAGVAYATAHLGRIAARQGRAEDAARLLDEARAVSAAAGGRETLEVDGMRAEACLLAGDPLGALEIADVSLAGAGSADERERAAPVLERVRAYALGRLGRFDQARAAAVASLSAAHAQAIGYDAALAQIAAARIEAWAGRPAQPTAQAWAALGRLGVTEIPEVPEAADAR